MAEEGTRKPHILVMPLPGHGHMHSLLHLSHRLASLHVAVTVLTTPQNLKYLSSLLERASAECLTVRPLVFPLPTIDGLPPGTETMAGLHHSLIPLFMLSLQQLSKPLEQWFSEPSNHSDFGRPICIISDMFMGWTQKTAWKLGIPRLVFYTCSVFAVSVINSIWKHLPHLDLKRKSDEDEVLLPELPFPVIFRLFQISTFARSFAEGDTAYECLRENILLNDYCFGAIINTFYELEETCIDHLQKHLRCPVWAVGPLLPPAEGTGVNDFRLWLDCRKKKSVVYVCFGTQSALTAAQAEALAEGLEESGEFFIWAMDNETESALPGGFEERVRGKGLLIKGWAPQQAFLRHLSTGCFISHCGWNSTLESLSAGVPMVTWPLMYDQHYNEYLVVEHLGMGVRLCEDERRVPEKGRVKAVIHRLLGEDDEAAETQRAVRFKEAARCSVQEGGCSTLNLEELAQAISKLGDENGIADTVIPSSFTEQIDV